MQCLRELGPIDPMVVEKLQALANALSQVGLVRRRPKRMEQNAHAENKGALLQGGLCLYTELGWPLQAILVGDVLGVLELLQNTGELARKQHPTNCVNWIPLCLRIQQCFGHNLRA